MASTSVGRPPSDETLEQLTTAYGPERDLKALTYAILTADEFLQGRATIISGPVDWFIGLLRSLRVSLDQEGLDNEVAQHLRLLGQLPFNPPSVGGWPGGQAWLSTATAGLRMRAARFATERGDLSDVADQPESQRVDSAGYLLGVGAWSDSSAKTLQAYKHNPPALILAAANTPEYLTT